MALEAILVGDLHFDKMRKLFGDQANSLVANELDKACAYAYENAIPNVIQLGDVSEKSRMSYDGHCNLLKILFKLDDKLNIHILLGNHDFDEYGVNSLQILQLMCDSNVFKSVFIHSKSTQVEIDGVTCNFLAWPDLKPMKAGRQPINFGHFETAGATGDNGRKLKHGEEVDEKHVFYNGHLHTPHTSGNVHYVGTLFQTSFGERLPKSMTYLSAKYDSGGKKLIIKDKRLTVDPDFQLHNLVVNSKKDLKGVDDNPLWLYRLLISEGVDVPDNWIEQRPNIVKVEGYSDKAELEALSAEEWLPQDQDGAPIIDEKDELHNLLVNKYDLTSKRAGRAVTLLDGLFNKEAPVE